MNVKQIQANLSLNGFGPLEIDGIVGPMTTRAVKACQVVNKLKEDGQVGPDTLAVILAPIKGNLKLRAVQIMTTYEGLRETGNNAGPEVEKFLASVGLLKGNAWCMAFIYYCFSIAAAELKRENPMVRTGKCLTQLHESTAKKSNLPKTGDVGIIDLGGGHGHTFAVISVVEGIVWTVEGNTNDNGSPNGDGVYLRHRRPGVARSYITFE